MKISKKMSDVGTAIIGGGVVGLAVAAKLSASRQSVVVLEKNDHYGMETSSRNSEVIHAGIYYTPGSLKAKLCVEGRDEIYSLCRKHDIPYKEITKLITAADASELGKLESIYNNGLKNGIPLEIIDRRATLKLEPNIRTVGSIYSPLTGIVSAHGLMDYFYRTFLEHGGTLQLRCEVIAIEKLSSVYQITVREGSEESTFTSDVVINAAGLFADKIAALVGIDVDKAGYRQFFAKGSYFSMIPSKAKLVSRLVYPVPKDEGLGVHALIDWGGRLKFGPDVEYLEDGTFDYSVAEEKRSAFAESIRRILPGIVNGDITPDMSGIRAKLQRKGEPPRDFLIVHEKERGLEGLVNLLGIDSPGLTSSPAIARHVENLLS
ncbi:MAG: NAD(P)/FAD-dependent oxidoreductase [Ignavibacteriales bacterium]|nr:NAD(P)/FAD-dependent oxidoreductase [Ignavibacteriales bacterium]